MNADKNPNSNGAILTGTVARIDHFGNVITNFQAAEFPDLHERRFAFKIGKHTVIQREQHFPQMIIAMYADLLARKFCL